MKIIPNSIRKPGRRRARAWGKSTVELTIFLALAYFGVSAGIDWYQGAVGPAYTDAELRDLAREAVFVAETAERAGVNLIIEGDITATVDRISQGRTAASGEFRGQYFGMPELRGKAKDGVAQHLLLLGGRLSVREADSLASVH